MRRKEREGEGEREVRREGRGGGGGGREGGGKPVREWVGDSSCFLFNDCCCGGVVSVGEETTWAERGGEVVVAIFSFL